MNPTTKAALEAFIQKTITGAEAAGNFAADQMPLLVQEWLRWKVGESIAWIVAFLFLIGFVWAIRRYCVRDMKADSRYDRDSLTTSFVLSMAATTLFSGLILIHALTIIKVFVAPRVLVVEYFASLVKP